MRDGKVQALSKRFIRKLAEEDDSGEQRFRFPKPWWQARNDQSEPPISSSPDTRVIDQPYGDQDTILAPPPEFEEEYGETILPPPPNTPTLPSPKMETYRAPSINVGVEVPVGEVMAVVPEQVFSEYLSHNAPEGAHQMVTLSIGDQTVGAYSVTDIPGQKTPQIRKMTNVYPVATSLDEFMTWLETNQPTTWWKAKQVMKKYQ